MDEVIPRNPSSIRKSAFGRTTLFIPSSNVLLREVQCMGGVNRYENVSIYHMHKTNDRKVDCWHCCEAFEGETFNIPRLYDPVEKVYHVYGSFCSPNCGKAYILENSTYDRGQHLNTFVRMLREVYGVTEKVVEAPPRISLNKFGGPFNIENFRSMKNICSIIKPPFVSYCMVVEERTATKATDKHELFKSSAPKENMDEDISDIPSKPLYEDFLKNKTTKTSLSEPEVKPTRSRKRKEKDDSEKESMPLNTLAMYQTKK